MWGLKSWKQRCLKAETRVNELEAKLRSERLTCALKSRPKPKTLEIPAERVREVRQLYDIMVSSNSKEAQFMLWNTVINDILPEAVHGNWRIIFPSPLRAAIQEVL